MGPAISHGAESAGASPQSPIQHVVVIFQENVSFDDYFGTSIGSEYAAWPSS